MLPQVQSIGSLKTRITLFTLAIFITSLWSLTFYASHVLRQDMERQLSDQQFSVVSFIASAVDVHLTERIRALQLAASSIEPSMMGQPTALQRLLDSRMVLETMFSGGVLITDRLGTAVAEVPRSVGRIGLNFMDRTAVAGALRQGQTVIGSAVLDKRLGVPVIGIAVPVLDAHGRSIGTLAGVVALKHAGFLDHLTQSAYGKTGSYFLVDRQRRLIIASTNRERVLQPLRPRGEIPAIDRFIDGFEGSQVYVNPNGVEVLNSAKRATVADWGVSASISTAEAFAPIRAMQQRMVQAALLLTVLAGVLTWWLLRRELSPLTDTTRILAQMGSSPELPQPLPVQRHDEIGVLIQSFNRLLAERKERDDYRHFHSQILEKLAAGTPLNTILEAIVLGIEALYPDKLCSILLLDEAGQCVTGCIAPSLPDFYNKAFDGLAVGVGMGSCGTAAFMGQRVVVEDIATHPYWEPLKELAAQVGLGACWAEPIRSGSHKILGAFGIYHREKYAPNDADIALIEQTARLVSIAIEKTVAEEKIRNLAYYDSLTQLPNRRLLDERLALALASSRRTGRHGALMLLDLDNFKPLNDTHGHAAGDLLLIEVARRLNANVREVDTVARLGGDEFVVVIGDLDAAADLALEQALAVAEKIRTALAQPYPLTIAAQQDTPAAVIEHHCSSSMGLTLFTGQDAHHQTELLKQADDAMYRAKQSGRNTVHL